MILKVNFPLDVMYYLLGMSPRRTRPILGKNLYNYCTESNYMQVVSNIQATNAEMKGLDQPSTYYGKDNIYNQKSKTHSQWRKWIGYCNCVN